MNNKLMNIAVIFLLSVIAILLALNLLKNSGDGGAIATAPVVDPGLKPEDDPYLINQVKNTIVKNSGSIQECYNKLLDREPEKFEGRVKMDWRINGDGEVVEPEKVTAEFGDEKFWNCMKSGIRKWEFPEPPGGIEKYVSHKFFFKKNPEQQGESQKDPVKSSQ